MRSLLKAFQLVKPSLATNFWKSNRRCYSIVAEPLDPYQEEMLNEKLILVDENDKIIGSDSKKNCHLIKFGKIPLHRAFSAIIFNSKKEIVLQKRASCKVTYPGYLTNACCSHPLYDVLITRDNQTNAKLAVQRRLVFELGIPVSQVIPGDFKFLTKIHYFSEGDGKWGEHEIDYIYIIQRDYDFTPNGMEVEQLYTVSRKEFNDFVKGSGLPLTPWFELLIKHWLFKWWDNLDELPSFRDGKIHRYL